MDISSLQAVASDHPLPGGSNAEAVIAAVKVDELRRTHSNTIPHTRQQGREAAKPYDKAAKPHDKVAKPHTPPPSNEVVKPHDGVVKPHDEAAKPPAELAGIKQGG